MLAVSWYLLRCGLPSKSIAESRPQIFGVIDLMIQNVVHYELYTIHTIHYTHYTLYTLYTTHYTLYTTHYTLLTIHYTLYTIH